METKKNSLLFVSGILMIIGGAIALILWGVLAATLATVLSIVGDTDGMQLVAVSTYLGLGGSVIQLVAGILGVANAAKPQKATVCIIFGFLTFVISIVANVLNVAGNNKVSVVSIILGIVLPVIYLIGAFQNKKLAQTIVNS